MKRRNVSSFLQKTATVEYKSDVHLKNNVQHNRRKSSVQSEREKMKLLLHNQEFNSGEELIINPELFPDIEVNDILEIKRCDGRGLPRLVLQVHSVAPIKGKLQISILKDIAAQFKLEAFQEVYVEKISPADITVDFIELTFKDQFISRADIWRFKVAMFGRSVYRGKNLELQGSRVQVKKLLRDGGSIPCGVIGTDTKLILRSRSSRFFWLIQMSREMWDFADSGEMHFEKLLNKLIKVLIERWQNEGVTHSLTILLFSRSFYDKEQFPHDFNIASNLYKNQDKTQGIGPGCHISNKGSGYGPAIHQTINSELYEDFYKVVVMDYLGPDWSKLMRLLKEEFIQYAQLHRWRLPNDFIPVSYKVKFSKSRKAVDKQDQGFSMDNQDSYMEWSTNPCGIPSKADEGNVLEAINVTLNVLDKHYMDRDLHRSGQSILMISAGVGVFKVDQRLAHITKQRMMDNGIGMDMISLSTPPLHSVPLFIWQKGSASAIPSEINENSSGSTGSAKCSSLTENSFLNSWRGASGNSDGGDRSNSKISHSVQERRNNSTYNIPHWINLSFLDLQCRCTQSISCDMDDDNSLMDSTVDLSQDNGSRCSCDNFSKGSFVPLPAFRKLDNCSSNNALSHFPNLLKKILKRNKKGYYEQDTQLSSQNLEQNTSTNLTETRPMNEPIQPHAIPPPSLAKDDDFIEYDNGVFDVQKRPSCSFSGSSSQRHHLRSISQQGSLSSSIMQDPEDEEDDYQKSICAKENDPFNFTCSPTTLESSYIGNEKSRSNSIYSNLTPQSHFSSSSSRSRGNSACSNRSVFTPSSSPCTNTSTSSTSKLKHLKVANGLSTTRCSSKGNTLSSQLSVSFEKRRGFMRAPPPVATTCQSTNQIKRFQFDKFPVASVVNSTNINTTGSYVFGTLKSSVHNDDNSGSSSDFLAKSNSQQQQQQQQSVSSFNPFQRSRNQWSDFRLTSNRRRWTHLFPDWQPEQTQHCFGPKWMSLVSPAILPLSTDFYPNPQDLEVLYNESFYAITLDSANVGTVIHSHLHPIVESKCSSENSDIIPFYPSHKELVMEMVGQRLAHDFQLVATQSKGNPLANTSGVVSPGDAATANNSTTTNSSSISTVMSSDMLKNSNASNTGSLARGPGGESRSSQGIIYYLSMGHRIHQISYDEELQTIEVKRYFKKKSTHNVNSHPILYRYSLYVSLTNSFHPLEQSFFEFPTPDYNWNYLDQVLCGTYDDMPESTKYRRICFALVPPVQTSSEKEAEYLAHFQSFLEFIQTKLTKFGERHSCQLHVETYPTFNELSNLEKYGLTSSNNGPESFNSNYSSSMKKNRMMFYKMKMKPRSTTRQEWIVLGLDSLHNSQQCYNFEIRWIACSGQTVDDFSSLIIRKCKQMELVLLRIPEFARISFIQIQPILPCIFFPLALLQNIKVHLRFVAVLVDRLDFVFDEEKVADSRGFGVGLGMEKLSRQQQQYLRHRRMKLCSTSNKNEIGETTGLHPRTYHQFMHRSIPVFIRVTSLGIVWIPSYEYNDVNESQEAVEMLFEQIKDHIQAVALAWDTIEGILETIL